MSVIRLDDDVQNFINIKINGTTYKVNSSEVPIDTSLNAFIRDYAKLSGTKFMCKEGGCGACVVVIESEDPATKQIKAYAVNSCLLRVWSCYGANVTTIEGAKDYLFKSSKLSISEQLAKANGSQCGYCSPGMVMNMYGLIKSKGITLTEQDVETGFAGNICRCTGYFPILKAFRSLVNPALKIESCEQDIEDCACPNNCPMKNGCNSSDEEDFEAYFIENALASPSFKINFVSGRAWYHPSTVKEINEIFDQIGSQTYMLINGNTAQGVSPSAFRDNPVQNYIDLRDIEELHTTSISLSGIQVGANISLTEFVDVLHQAWTNKSFGNLFQYASELEEHIGLVANVPVRNTGTIAGNLSIKYNLLHPANGVNQMFQSDIFLLLETINATITIVESSTISNTYSPASYLTQPSMQKKLITKVSLPPLDSTVYKIHTYKIMPTAQNVPASVNAGFLFKMKNPTSTVIDSARIVYGGINPEFVHASKTESYLSGKDISNEQVLQGGIKELKMDLQNVVDEPPAFPPAFRRQLAINLFYKTVLWINQNKVNPKYKSGADKLELSRQLVSGKSVFGTVPVGARGAPIPKIEASIQCKGEAEYANDIPVIHNQLYAATVVAPSAPGVLGTINSSKAMAMPGVVAFYSAKDVPGLNNMYPIAIVTLQSEELFCSKLVKYAGQPVGIVVAESQDLAILAARSVTVEVLNPLKVKPLLTVDDVLKKYLGIYPNPRVLIQPQLPASSLQQSSADNKVDVEQKVEDLQPLKIIDGEFEMGSQYHYTLELQTCVVIPIEDGQFDVYPSSQWPLNIQVAISQVLAIPQNKVNVVVRRVGGAFGCKVTKAAYVGGATAIAAYLLKRPVRMVMDLEANTKAIGKRAALKCFYSVTVNTDTGKIVAFTKLDFLDNKGLTMNDILYLYIKGGAINCYDIAAQVTLGIKSFAVLTDLPSSSWFRAPGTLEGISVIETIMNKIALSLNNPKLDSFQVRLNNISADKTHFIEFLNEKKLQVNYSKQITDVQAFNQKNRWRKQGFSIIPMQFPIDFFFQFYCTVSINAGDGTISISHGACEIGQGINTKVAVAAAYIFGLPDISRISVKPTNIVYSPNNFLTGGSMATDAISYACMRACEEIKDRLDIMKKKLKLPDDISWFSLINTAFSQLVNLNATFMFEPNTTEDPSVGLLRQYAVCGVGAALVEVDILTGQHIVRHAWIWEDAGDSLAPLIDLGQIEGAFIMGLGYFTSEEIQYNPDTGELLTNRTWNYSPPGALDIPEIFDVTVENRRPLGGRKDPITQKTLPPPYGVTGAKATGEPPLCLSLTVLFAIKEAIRSARKDAGLTEIDFDFNPPATIALKVMQSEIDDSKFKITSN